MPAPAPKREGRSASLLIFSLVTLDLVGFAMVLPLLASYGARHGAGDAMVGALVASYSLLHFLLAPAWGRRASCDGARAPRARSGRRRNRRTKRGQWGRLITH